MVESKVDKAKECRVHLSESCHYSVVDICWVLKEEKNRVELSFSVKLINTSAFKIIYNGSVLIMSNLWSTQTAKVSELIITTAPHQPTLLKKICM